MPIHTPPRHQACAGGTAAIMPPSAAAQASAPTRNAAAQLPINMRTSFLRDSLPSRTPRSPFATPILQKNKGLSQIR
jgi:hypothetical protein